MQKGFQYTYNIVLVPDFCPLKKTEITLFSIGFHLNMSEQSPRSVNPCLSESHSAQIRHVRTLDEEKYLKRVIFKDLLDELEVSTV